jgi:hypothetical protein
MSIKMVPNKVVAGNITVVNNTIILNKGLSALNRDNEVEINVSSCVMPSAFKDSNGNILEITYRIRPVMAKARLRFTEFFWFLKRSALQRMQLAVCPTANRGILWSKSQS